MWDEVGILRSAAGLARGASRLRELEHQLDATGVAGDDRGFNLTWHDWLNLKNLIRTSQVITAAALAREDSRGAHYREDFPDTGDLATSDYTVARLQGDVLGIAREAVRFTRVVPGQTLLTEEPA